MILAEEYVGSGFLFLLLIPLILMGAILLLFGCLAMIMKLIRPDSKEEVRKRFPLPPKQKQA